MTLPPLNLNFASGADTGPAQATQVTPWNQGDIVLATGGSNAKSGDRTAPASTAELLSGLGLSLGGGLFGMPTQTAPSAQAQPRPQASAGVSMGISSTGLVIAGVILVGAVLWRKFA